jgi:hypothetical protein
VRRLLSAKHSVYAGWEEQPQPAPPGCGIHFIHFIETAINRGPNLPEGITQSLQLCNDWQGENFWRKTYIRFARFEIVSKRTAIVQ